MALPVDPATVPWPFVLAIGSLTVIYYLFRKRADAFAEIGFSSKEVWLLSVGSMAGWASHIPILRLGDAYLAVNLGGALVPILIVLWWIRNGKLQIARALVGTLLVSAVAYRVVDFEPSKGIIAAFPWFFLPPVVAFVFALLSSPRAPLKSVPVAYTAGSLGALLGADVYNYPVIAAHFRESRDGVIVSMGGAGVFDMVFLAGALAMAMHLSLALALERPAGDAEAAVTVYPGKPVEVRAPPHAWDAFVALPDANAAERAVGALSLSNDALTASDYPRTVRMAWLAVHTLLDASPRARDLTQGPTPLAHDTALLAELAGRAKDPAAAGARPVTRREAGDANDTAKLVVARLMPVVDVPQNRMEGY